MQNQRTENYEDFENRVSIGQNPERVLREACRDFNLGKFLSGTLVRQGYEDYNVKLMASKGTYFVKMFSSFRSRSECQRIVDIINYTSRNGVSTPRLLKGRQGYLYMIQHGKAQVRLCIMDYISGQNLFKLGIRPSPEEIRTLARQAALINSLRLRPRPLYDSWALFSLPKIYTARGRYLSAADRNLVSPVVGLMRKVNLHRLPYAFVHGDILGMNVIKDRKGKLWIVDFSVSNYYPRITELAVFASDLLLDAKRKSKSDRNLEIALEEYQKTTPLTDYELEVLPIFVKAQHAVHLINPVYYKAKFKTNTQENAHLLSQSRAGLRQMLE